LWERAAEEGAGDTEFCERTTTSVAMDVLLGMNPNKRAREASAEDEDDVRVKVCTFGPYDAVRYMLTFGVDLKSEKGLLMHAISSEAREPCVLASVNILQHVFNFSNETKNRITVTLRNECTSPSKWVQLLYLSLCIAVQALRATNPANKEELGDIATSLKETAEQLRMKSLHENYEKLLKE
jgi:hypothetical protein